MNIVIKKLNPQDCTPEMLLHFNRYQEVKRCWRKIDSEWVLIDNPFIQEWDNERKSDVAKGLRHCINQGGVALGAFDNDKLIGFASMPNQSFGTNNEYIQLEMLHVSYEYRGKGIGKDLFREICDEAKFFGAKKFYISAHSSEESTGFYRSVGCVDAVEVNQRLFEEEPVDCHLEYSLH